MIESVSTMGGSIEVVGWKEGYLGRVDMADVNDEAESEEGTEPSDGLAEEMWLAEPFEDSGTLTSGPGKVVSGSSILMSRCLDS